jgi:hypothetical protein
MVFDLDSILNKKVEYQMLTGFDVQASFAQSSPEQVIGNFSRKHDFFSLNF